jgi:hypothetical protein
LTHPHGARGCARLSGWSTGAMEHRRQVPCGGATWSSGGSW